MHRQSFTISSLRKVIRTRDFNRKNFVSIKTNLHKILQDGVICANQGFCGKLHYNKTVLYKKPTYKLTKYSNILVLRKATDNIRQAYNIRLLNRNVIIDNMLSFLAEGVRYRVYKLDIKSFYESINTNDILISLEQNVNITIPTVRVISTLLEKFKEDGIGGLPRGLSISAALSEVAMDDFDTYVKRIDDVFFYSRYVDDIIIITSMNENPTKFMKEIKKKLPKDLRLNTSKIDIKAIPDAVKGTAASGEILDFNYLGYNFKVYNPVVNSKNVSKEFRNVVIDISDKKIKKIKTRMVRSFIAFVDDGDFELLIDRFKSLTGNYCIYDDKTDSKIKTGIYYNYKHVTKLAAGGIEELDLFLKRILLSKKGPVSEKICHALNNQQRKRLLTLTFKNGFDKKVMHHFSYTKLRSIKRCWIYV